MIKIFYEYRKYKNYGLCQIQLQTNESIGFIDYTFNTKSELERRFPFYYEKV